MRKKQQPFADDEMLRQLHEHRAAHHRRTTKLTAAEYIAQLERETSAGLKAHGFAIKRKADGTEVIARVVKKHKTA